MQPDTFYHIYNRANGSESLFRSEENYRYFLQQWVKHISSIANTYAYCLMPNHFHFLIRTRSEDELKINYPVLGKFETFQDLITFRISKQFANMFSGYTQAYNKMFDRHGSLFNPNFKKKPITSDSYLTNLILYIHNNPVQHAFSSDIGSWPHCSYQVILANNQTFLMRQEVIDWFGNKEDLITIHNKPMPGLNMIENKFG